MFFGDGTLSESYADVVARPGQEVAHIGFRAFYGGGEVVAFGQICGNGARQGVARSVAVVQHEFLLRVWCESVCGAVVEVVHQVVAFLHALHQHAAPPFRQFLQVAFGVGDGMPQQEGRFVYVRCYKRGKRKEQLLVGFDNTIAHQFLALEVHKDRVDEDGLLVVSLQNVGCGMDNLVGGHEPRLDAIGTYGAQKRLRLRDNQVGGQVVDALDAVHVLVHDARQRSSCPAATAGNGLYVSLDTGTSQRFAAGNEENFACIYLFFHTRRKVTAFMPINQKISDIFARATLKYFVFQDFRTLKLLYNIRI